MVAWWYSTFRCELVVGGNLDGRNIGPINWHSIANVARDIVNVVARDFLNTTTAQTSCSLPDSHSLSYKGSYLEP